LPCEKATKLREVLTSLQALLRLATLRWLGVFICALATLLATTSTASALEPAQAKTRVWGFDLVADNSSGLFRAASSGKHQENRLAQAEEASGSLLAARAGANANKLNHIFGKAEHALDGFVKAQGGQQKAFQAIQSAANKALAEGKLVPGPNGVLPSGNAGPIIDVAGTQIRLIGGRVIDGVVEIGSASRMGLP